MMPPGLLHAGKRLSLASKSPHGNICDQYIKTSSGRQKQVYQNYSDSMRYETNRKKRTKCRWIPTYISTHHYFEQLTIVDDYYMLDRLKKLS